MTGKIAHWGWLALIGALLWATHAAALPQVHRGVWYDYAGLDKTSVNGEIALLKRYNIDTVHIEISSLITDMGLFARCKKENGNVASENAKQCAIRTYVFGFDKWVAKPGRESLPDFIEALQSSGFRVYLMIWPVPTRDYRESLVKLYKFVSRHPVYGIELEDENNWSNAYLSPQYTSLSAAADDLFADIRANTPKSIKIGVTTNPRNFALAAFASDRLITRAEFISFQSYQNVCVKGGDHCPTAQLAGRYAPGVMQDRGMETIAKAPLPRTSSVVMGLAAYDQSIAPYSGDVNMFTALRETLCAKRPPEIGSRFDEVSYWSLKNIVLPKQHDGRYAHRMLARCTNEAVLRSCSTPKTADAYGDAKRICPAVFE